MRNNESGSHSKNTSGKAIGISKKITKELLTDLYVNKQLSLADIAKIFGCNRQNIQYWKRKFGIAGRSKADARVIAHRRGKIVQKFESKNFASTKAIHLKYDTKFFKQWSNEMSYCLGIIYSDGNISLGRDNGNSQTTRITSSLSISQKDPEILKKIKTLMKSNVRLCHRNKRVDKYGRTSGAVYTIQFSKTEIVRDLMALGLEPNKSLTMKFPEIPLQFQRHFVRGLWDGDGCIRITARSKNSVYWRGDYVSGSKVFVDKMYAILINAGLKKVTYYYPPNANAIYLRVNEPDIPQFFHFMYDNVNENAYYSRKYLDFRKATQNRLLKIGT